MIRQNNHLTSFGTPNPGLGSPISGKGWKGLDRSPSNGVAGSPGLLNALGRATRQLVRDRRRSARTVRLAVYRPRPLGSCDFAYAMATMVDAPQRRAWERELIIRYFAKLQGSRRPGCRCRGCLAALSGAVAGSAADVDANAVSSADHTGYAAGSRIT